MIENPHLMKITITDKSYLVNHFLLLKIIIEFDDLPITDGDLPWLRQFTRG